MRVAIAQINPRVGDLAANAKKIIARIDEARASGAKLVLFPELSVNGYSPRDLLDSPSFIEATETTLQSLASATTDGTITAIVGFAERVPGMQGRATANSAAVLAGGRVTAVYRKRLLPYYDVFEEERHFERGNDPGIVDIDGARVAITICEDLWDDAQALPRPYGGRIRAELASAKPDLVVNLTASPFHLGKPAFRGELFARVAREVKAPLLLACQVGANDELIFDGGSLLLAADGTAIAQAPVFREALVVADTDGTGAIEAWPTEEEEWLRQALCLGLGDYLRKSGAISVCLGLSGGIDSSVVAMLAVDALGPQAVTALALPTRFNAAASLEDARTLATNLGIALREVAVQPLQDAMLATWQSAFGRMPKAITAENFQPRLRMALLMGFANETGGFLLNTSNKSEIATGYTTLYGDSAGALAVIGDLTKGQVYRLARHGNRRSEKIPARVIERAPSAELRENQKDQDSLPSYDVLDALVERVVVGNLDAAALKAEGFNAADVDRFLALYETSEWKRAQLPPVLRVSPRAFGRGRRIPIASAKPWR